MNWIIGLFNATVGKTLARLAIKEALVAIAQEVRNPALRAAAMSYYHGGTFNGMAQAYVQATPNATDDKVEHAFDSFVKAIQGLPAAVTVRVSEWGEREVVAGLTGEDLVQTFVHALVED